MSALTMIKRDGLRIGGAATAAALTIPRKDLDKVIIRGVSYRPSVAHPAPGQPLVVASRFKDFDGAGVALVVPDLDLDQATVVFGGRHNAFVNQGLQRVLDSAYGDLVADRITHIGLSADDQTVTAATTSLDPAGGATGTSIKTTANTGRVNQTVHADQTWTQADVSWAIRKIGLLTGSAATDVANIIGGSGGASPYDEPFTIDLTSIATWSLTMGIDVQATAT